ncbi:hypothetical protein GCM10027414_19650 [Humibacter ginsengiterrae]
MSSSNAPVADSTAALSDAFDALTAALGDVLPATGVHGLGDEVLLTATRVVETLGRKVDALRAHCAGAILERSPKGLGADRLSARNGCRTPAELTARLTGVSEATATRRAALGQAVAVRGSLTGGLLPPKFPAVAQAVGTGDLGEDAARIIVNTLSSIEHRADPEDWAAAEADLVASAVEGGFTADQTRVQATVWRVALDPDGVEGDAEEAMRHRALTRLGTRGGLVRYRMELMPEISGKLEQAIAAVVSPKSKPTFLNGDQLTDGGLDDRSSPQRRHDAFASLIDAAARSAEVASMGGCCTHRAGHRGRTRPPRGAWCRVDRRGSGADPDDRGHPVRLRRRHPKTPDPAGTDRVVVVTATLLHPTATPCDRRPRPWMCDPRMSDPGQLVRDPPRGRALQGRTHRNRQRSRAQAVA